MNNFADWLRFDHEDFRIHFQYPASTPKGHPVNRDEDDFRGAPRVHLTGGAHKEELYVEVVCFADLTPAEEYASHVEYLSTRFGPDSIAPLTEMRVAGHSGWTYAFHWGKGERTVLLLPARNGTYRIIYDPRSVLNEKAVSTLTLEE